MELLQYIPSIYDSVPQICPMDQPATCANLLILQVPMPTLNSPGHTASREDRPALLAVNDQPGSLFRR